MPMSTTRQSKISCPRNFGPSRGNGYIEPKLVQNIDILFVKLHIFECFLFFDWCKETHAHVLFAFGKRGSGVCFRTSGQGNSAGAQSETMQLQLESLHEHTES